jgi:hypothetical protein
MIVAAGCNDNNSLETVLKKRASLLDTLQTQ